MPSQPPEPKKKHIVEKRNYPNETKFRTANGQRTRALNFDSGRADLGLRKF